MRRRAVAPHFELPRRIATAPICWPVVFHLSGLGASRLTFGDLDRARGIKHGQNRAGNPTISTGSGRFGVVNNLTRFPSQVSMRKRLRVCADGVNQSLALP
jgi:hypothetical protein